VREISLHILDILQNSVEAGASHIELTIDEDLPADVLAITVTDDGRGMDAATVQKVTDPFYTSRKTRHVGLGVPLLASAAEHCDGRVTIESQPGVGTTLTATFRHSHIDRAPLGNMVDTLLAFVLTQPNPPQRAIELVYRHSVDGRAFELDTAAIRRELEGVPFSHPEVRDWLRDFIAEGEIELYKPVTADH
jgi:signal transduction histidine kinase